VLFSSLEKFENDNNDITYGSLIYKFRNTTLFIYLYLIKIY